MALDTRRHLRHTGRAMRRLQRFLLCVLCAALPLRVSAEVLDVPAPCPMSPPQSQAMAPATDAATDIAGMDACCEHGDQAGEAACKAGQDCPCGGPGIPVTAARAVPGPRPALRALPVRLLVAACHPYAVWRPPTLI
ncbi:hypothetical protein PG2T_08015 [Immundisolibacter cernigliae]|uniref:CopL family metal-binding regulatory protein n=2 Tax=Immundisolibacter cernigliae TaxID=1810504 RepID=A0A1B1YTD4_9GAMM|nr:hypothetical protein PG2T_08015 [Immundisolibacter cernigliae]